MYNRSSLREIVPFGLQILTLSYTRCVLSSGKLFQFHQLVTYFAKSVSCYSRLTMRLQFLTFHWSFMVSFNKRNVSHEPALKSNLYFHTIFYNVWSHIVRKLLTKTVCLPISADKTPVGFPVITQSPSTRVIEIGHSAIMQCRATGTPAVKIYWVKDMKRVDMSNPRYTLNNGKC